MLRKPGAKVSINRKVLLKEVPELSASDPGSGNASTSFSTGLLVEGDKLLALKALLPSYVDGQDTENNRRNLLQLVEIMGEDSSGGNCQEILDC